MGSQTASWFMQTMTNGRALLTEIEREYLLCEHGDQRQYEARHRFRERIRRYLSQDIDVLRENEPELVKELRDVVCNN